MFSRMWKQSWELIVFSTSLCSVFGLTPDSLRITWELLKDILSPFLYWNPRVGWSPGGRFAHLAIYLLIYLFSIGVGDGTQVLGMLALLALLLSYTPSPQPWLGFGERCVAFAQCLCPSKKGCRGYMCSVIVRRAWEPWCECKYGARWMRTGSSGTQLSHL